MANLPAVCSGGHRFAVSATCWNGKGRATQVGAHRGVSQWRANPYTKPAMKAYPETSNSPNKARPTSSGGGLVVSGSRLKPCTQVEKTVSTTPGASSISRKQAEYRTAIVSANAAPVRKGVSWGPMAALIRINWVHKPGVQRQTHIWNSPRLQILKSSKAIRSFVTPRTASIFRV